MKDILGARTVKKIALFKLNKKVIDKGLRPCPKTWNIWNEEKI